MNNHKIIKAIRKKREERKGRNASPPVDPSMMDHIGNKVLKYFPGVTLNELKNKKRFQELVIPRQLWIYYSVMCFDYSFVAAAGYVGERDHSTAHHAVKRVEEWCETSDVYLDTFLKIFFNEIVSDDLCKVKIEECFSESM